MPEHAVLLVIMCVHDERYAIILVTQQKKRNMQPVYARRLRFHFTFNFTKPFVSGSKKFWTTNIKDKC